MAKLIKISRHTFKLYKKTLVPIFSPSENVSISIKEAKKALSINNALFLRYVSNFDKKQETDFWYIIKDKHKELEEFSSKRRYEIKKGLKAFDVKKVDFKFIKENCYKVYKKALEKYGSEAMSEDEFKAEKLPLIENREFWIVCTKNDAKIVGYSQNIIENQSCNYTYVKLDPDYIKKFSSYALFFEMDKHYLKERGFKFVNDGARSIAHETNIQQFLIQKLGYRKAYCDLNVIFNPRISWIVTLLYPFRKIIKIFSEGLYIVLLHKQFTKG